MFSKKIRHDIQQYTTVFEGDRNGRNIFFRGAFLEFFLVLKKEPDLPFSNGEYGGNFSLFAEILEPLKELSEMDFV